MPNLYSAKQVLKALKKAGFKEISQKGSHIKLRGLREEKLSTVIVPNHEVIAKGTFSSVLRQAEMTRKEFENYL
jgi:predicted RNA binding protein YcfA (HicA-like mRNA interferase family)